MLPPEQVCHNPNPEQMCEHMTMSKKYYLFLKYTPYCVTHSVNQHIYMYVLMTYNHHLYIWPLLPNNAPWIYFYKFTVTGGLIIMVELFCRVERPFVLLTDVIKHYKYKSNLNCWLFTTVFILLYFIHILGSQTLSCSVVSLFPCS